VVESDQGDDSTNSVRGEKNVGLRLRRIFSLARLAKKRQDFAAKADSSEGRCRMSAYQSKAAAIGPPPFSAKGKLRRRHDCVVDQPSALRHRITLSRSNHPLRSCPSLLWPHEKPEESRQVVQHGGNIKGSGKEGETCLLCPEPTTWCCYGTCRPVSAPALCTIQVRPKPIGTIVSKACIR
jgi:hypothetical protein